MEALIVIFVIFIPLMILWPIFGASSITVYGLFWLVLIIVAVIKGWHEGKKEKGEDKESNQSSIFFSQRDHRKNKKRNNENYYEDYPDYNWESHCEFCGEFLEDCECDNWEESRNDISL